MPEVLNSVSVAYAAQTGSETADSTMFVYECPGNFKSVIQSIEVSNPGGAVYTIRVIKKTPKSDGAFELFDLSLSAGDKVVDDTERVLSAGESLRFESSVVGVQLLLSFIEYPV